MIATQSIPIFQLSHFQFLSNSSLSKQMTLLRPSYCFLYLTMFKKMFEWFVNLCESADWFFFISFIYFSVTDFEIIDYHSELLFVYYVSLLHYHYPPQISKLCVKTNFTIELCNVSFFSMCTLFFNHSCLAF